MSPSPRLILIHLPSEDSRPEEGRTLRDAARDSGASYAPHEKIDPSVVEPSRSVVLVGRTPALIRAAEAFPAAPVLVLTGDTEGEGALELWQNRLLGTARLPLEAGPLREILSRAPIHAALLGEIHALRSRVAHQGRELQELNRIGAALSAERDIERLLEMILGKCREITTSDAGSLYLVERKEGAPAFEEDYFADKILFFRLTQGDSVHVPFRASRMDISRRSLAGYVALTGERLLIDDAYEIPEDEEYQFNRSFDESSGYRTRSLLIIPMKNHKDEMIGVLQLINRKRRREAILNGPEAVEELVIPFDEKTAELATSLASQAAVAIENARLYEEIQRLFEGFIRASVTAIESRDPTTSGHSERVAVLTVGLAEIVDREEAGPLREVRFDRDAIREIKYASLLHDFGKIGVKENVLLKGKKLYEHEVRAIQDRFRILRQGLELKFSREKLRYFMDKSREEALTQGSRFDADLEERLREMDRYLEVILEANEPSVLKGEASSILKIVGETAIQVPDLPETPLLESWELSNLSIPKGSLSSEERKEIESHVTHTFQFLSTIPWTRELQQIPRIAGAHHEKLDGTGYPAGIDVEAIPVESRMMTISDIFDALTAKDRPYKRAITPERALEILSFEVKEGKVDAGLYRLFVESKVFEKVLKRGSPAGS